MTPEDESTFGRIAHLGLRNYQLEAYALALGFMESRVGYSSPARQLGKSRMMEEAQRRANAQTCTVDPNDPPPVLTADYTEIEARLIACDEALWGRSDTIVITENSRISDTLFVRRDGDRILIEPKDMGVRFYEMDTQRLREYCMADLHIAEACVRKEKAIGDLIHAGENTLPAVPDITDDEFDFMKGLY